MKKILAFVLLSVYSFATTTITGHVNTLGTGSVTSGAYVRFWLRGCAGNQPRIAGSGLIAPTLGGVFFFDFPVSGSGTISGTLYSNRDATGVLGGEIECGGSTTSTWYGMQAFVGGKGGPEVPVYAKSTGTLDISNVTPITTNPVVVSPTGDSTYLRLDGGNSPVTGPVTLNGGDTFSGPVALNGGVVGPTTINGTTTFAGNIQPSTVDLSVAYADQFAGADMFAKANAAIASLTNGGTVILPATTGTSVATTITINTPNITLKCQNSAACIYNYTGTGDAIRVQMNPFSITQAQSIEGITINCSGCGSSANGLHAGDVIGLRLVDLHIENFVGANSSCLWTDNVLGWTERQTEQAIHLDGCTKAHRFTNTTNTQVTSSFGHWPFVDERWNLNGNQIGWSVEGGIIYDSGYFVITGNALGAVANTLLKTSGVQYLAGPATSIAGTWSETVEQSGGAPSSVFNVGAGTTIGGCGGFALGGLTLGTITGTLGVNGSTCYIVTNNSFYSAQNTGGSTVGLIGLDTSNLTVIKGDSVANSIAFEPVPGAIVATVNSAGPATPPIAFGSLAACTAGLEGTSRAVNNSNTAVYNAAVAGGGANHIVAYCNGTAWVAH